MNIRLVATTCAVLILASACVDENPQLIQTDSVPTTGGVTTPTIASDPAPTLTTPPTTVATTADTFEGVRKGASGPAVKQLQENLVLAGWDPGEIDSDYGELTEIAVGKAQADFGLEATGDADIDFIAELVEYVGTLPVTTSTTAAVATTTTTAVATTTSASTSTTAA